MFRASGGKREGGDGLKFQSCSRPGGSPVVVLQWVLLILVSACLWLSGDVVHSTVEFQ